jgi:uncharacterized protein
MQDFLDALKAGDLPAARHLLEKYPALKSGRNEQGASWLATSIYYGQTAIARLMVELGSEPDLFEAAMLGDLARVKQGLSHHGVDAFAPDGFPLLSLALFFGQPEVFRYLLEQGADVNLAARNPMRVAPLHAAAARGDLAAVQLLLERGADANARQQSGYVALHTAAASGRKEMAELLLAHGAHPDAATDAGETAADLAQQAGHAALAAWLAAKRTPSS